MKDQVIVWLKAARAPFLIVSLLPSILGGVMARAQGEIDWLVFLAATLGIVMAHSAADFIDDYFDFSKGHLGNKPKQFHDSPLIDKKITLNQVIVATAICLAVALFCGGYVFLKVGAPVIWLMAVGGFIVLFYTSPPLMLNYRGLGESMLFLAFGPMIVVGMSVVLTGRVTLESLLVSLVPGIFTMNIGVVSNTFDHAEDIAVGKRTMSVLYGQRATLGLIFVGSIIAYLTVLFGALSGVMPKWVLLVFLTLPLAILAVRRTSRFDDQGSYTPAMQSAIALSSASTVLLIVAYLLDIA